MTRRHAPFAVALGLLVALAPGAAGRTREAQRELPHMRVDRAQRAVILEARVVRRKADWLELIACSPGTREHESILVVPARPSHIHLGLILIGLEPGAPADWRDTPDGLDMKPPRGPPVAVTVRRAGAGRAAETPIRRWVRDAEREKPGPPPLGPFVFAGSEFRTFKGKEFYAADRSGNVISLVQFGDEVLARASERTHRTDRARWQPRTARIPKKGTKLELVLRPAAKKRRAATRPAR